MSASIERRLDKLESAIRRDEPIGLDALNDVELDLLIETCARACAADPAATEDHRASAQAELEEIAAERAKTAAYYARPDVAEAIRSNESKGYYGPQGPPCKCDALPYHHQSHRTIDEIATIALTHVEQEERAETWRR